MARTALYFILGVWLASLPALGGTTGKIAGRVTDRESGQPLVGANVFIQALGIGASTDLDGYYFILNIQPGRYDVTVSYVGYARLVETGVEVKVDRTSTLNIVMQPEAITTEEIVVSGQRLIVQRDKSSTIQHVNASEIQALPVNTVEGVLGLQTGVVVSGGGAIHVRGGRSGEVGFYVDGYRVEDPLFNSQVLEVNNQAIQEMEFLSGTFNAEYGNSLSGVVNIVTRENADALRGNLTYKMTNLGLERPSNRLNERYFEGTFSGPLWPESPVGFLVSGKKVNADNYHSSGLWRVSTDSLGKSFYESLEFSRGKPFGYDDYLTILSKVFVKPFPTGKITLLYNYSDRDWRRYDHVLRFIPDSSYTYQTGSSLLGVSFRHTPREDLFYDVRVSRYTYSYLRSLNGQHYSRYNFATFLRFDNSRFYRTLADNAYEDQLSLTYGLKGDLTWQIDRYNLVKTGLDLRLHDFDYFYINQPNNPVARFEISYRERPFEGAWYVQDKIEFETIVLNLGVRVDFYDPKARYVGDPFNPTSLETPKMRTAVSPRLGMAYPVLENVVFHFSYGQFFQRPEFQVMYENLNRIFGVGEPLFGSPTLLPEKTAGYELGVLASLGVGTTAQLTFFSKKIESLVGVAWNYFPLPFAYYVNEDFAMVKGFEISTKVQFGKLSGALNYTYSVAKGSSSSQQERYSGAFDVVGTQSLRFLPLSFDQPHTGSAQLAVAFGKDEGPFGFLPVVFERSSANLLARYGSGLPYTFNPERARYVADRNNARLPATLFVDLLVRRDLPVGPVMLTLFADIRNLLYRKNVRSVYSATGSPVYSGSSVSNTTPDYDRDPTNYYAPRTIYVGVTLGF